MKLKKVFICTVIFLLSLVSIANNKSYAINQNEYSTLMKASIKNEEEKTMGASGNKKTAKLIFVGDILPHDSMINYALSYGQDHYDFSGNFELVKEDFERADLVVANNEFCVDENLPIQSYPRFIIPEGIYNAIKNCGVDVLTNANNHCLDGDIEGIATTIDAIEKHDLKHVGTSKGPRIPYIVVDVNGIRVSILSYTQTLNGLDYLLDTPEKQNMVNILNKDYLKEDINLAVKQSDFVIVYPHWGEEYESYPNEYQIELAHYMLECGADLIIGNHPHVIEPKEFYRTKDGRDGIIYYSLGNFISNQCFETMEDYRTEHGLMVECDIEKKGDDRAKITEENYHVTWSGRTFDSYGTLNRIYPVYKYLDKSKIEEDITDSMFERMKIANDMTNELMESFKGDVK